MNDRTSTLSRRNFLLALGAGSAATAAVAAIRNSGPAAATAMPPTRRKNGYRASEHIVNYYRTASV